MASFYHLARAPVAVKKKRKRAEGKSDNVLLFASHFIVVIFFCFILFLGGGGLVRTVRAWNLMLKCWKWQEEGNSRMFPIEWTNVHSRFYLDWTHCCFDHYFIKMNEHMYLNFWFQVNPSSLDGHWRNKTSPFHLVCILLCVYSLFK